MGTKEEYTEDLKLFWPKNAPDISQVPKYVNKYKKEEIVIKCGGKVLIDPDGNFTVSSPCLIFDKNFCVTSSNGC